MKKLISIMLTLFMLFYLGSCGRTGTGDGTTPADTNTSTPESDAPAPSPLILAENGVPNYKVVYADNAISSVKKSAINLRINLNRFVKLAKISEFTIITDWHKPSEAPSADDLEILVGRTNREESKSVYSTIAENTYIIRVVGKKLVIAASHDNLLPYALTYFENNFLINREFTTEGSCKIPADTDIVFTLPAPDLKKMIASSYSITAEYTSVYEYSGIEDFRGTQGSCTDGTYIYVSLHRKDSSGVENTYIRKVRMSDWTVVATSEMLSVNHCNDMTYNPDINKIVITNMGGPTLTLLDPDTLKISNSINLNTSYTPYAITYSPSRRQYVIAASGRFLFVDSKFNIIDDKLKVSNNNYIGQGMDSDENYIYMPMSENTAMGTTDNIILVFDWNCSLVNTIHIATRMESETMFNTGGVQYVSFNNWGSSKIGNVSSIEYFINY